MAKPLKKDLLSLLERIQSLPVLVVGDIILDRYIWGKVERISPEAPVPVVEVRRTEDRLGGAGNVVRNLRNLNAKVTLCGYVGDDDEGQTVLKLLESDGVSRDGILIDRERPTCLKTRVIAHPQQIVRIDREDRSHRSPKVQEAFCAMVAAQMAASKLVIVSDYGKGSITELLMKQFAKARDDKQVGLGIRPLVVDPHPENFALYSGITVSKPNRKEAEQASGIKITSNEKAVEAASVLLKRWNAEMMLITLGEGGLMILERGGKAPVFLETRAQEVFDVSGAGDTVTALFSAAITVGADPALAGDLANIGAGIVVSEVGTVAIDPRKLRSHIEEYS